MGGPQAWVLSRFVLKLVYTGSVIPVPINLEYSSKMTQKWTQVRHYKASLLLRCHPALGYSPIVKSKKYWQICNWICNTLVNCVSKPLEIKTPHSEIPVGCDVSNSVLATNKQKEHWGSKKVGNILTSWVTIPISRKNLLFRVSNWRICLVCY